jgi:hypothetical protein
MNRNHERLISNWPTKAYIFDWRPGDHLRTPEGERYVVVAADDRHDDRVLIQKLALDRAKRPIRGLREGRPFAARAERDSVKVGRGRWARRIEEVERC